MERNKKSKLDNDMVYVLKLVDREQYLLSRGQIISSSRPGQLDFLIDKNRDQGEWEEVSLSSIDFEILINEDKVYTYRIYSALGHFVIGDICYFLKDEVYDKWSSMDYDIADGLIRYDNYAYAVDKTLYGSDHYFGSNGVKYPLHVHVIGAAPIELCNELKYLEHCSIIHANYIDFTCKNGVFTIEYNDKVLTIDRVSRN